MHAIPDNRAWRPRQFPEWLWSHGGYYAQMFWILAVPDNWGAGYYRQWFWNNAVPDNWAWRSKQPVDWPWSGGGYYTQWFWMSAVPASWAGHAGGTLGGANAVHPREKSLPLGYYELTLWNSAVPGGLVVERIRLI